MNLIFQKLKNDQAILIKAKYWLTISYEQCSAVGIKPEFSIDEFGAFETLCSRYSRTIDLLVRKVFRTLDEYEFESQGTLIDVVNHAHKRGLFEDVEQVRLMKDIRNTIVHEYIEENLQQSFEEVLETTPQMLSIVDATIRYMNAQLETNE